MSANSFGAKVRPGSASATKPHITGEWKVVWSIDSVVALDDERQLAGENHANTAADKCSNHVGKTQIGDEAGKGASQVIERIRFRCGDRTHARNLNQIVGDDLRVLLGHFRLGQGCGYLQIGQRIYELYKICGQRGILFCRADRQ